METFKSAVLPPVSTVKSAKKTRTLKFLKELSPPQSVLDFYSTLLDQQTTADQDRSGDDSD